MRPVSGVGGWRDSREDLGAAVGQLASREIQLHLQSVLVAEADELREPVDGHQVLWTEVCVRAREERFGRVERLPI